MKEEGVWRTIRHRKVFIKTGQSLTDAIRESGKFETKSENKYNNIEQFTCLQKYRDLNDEEYKKSYSTDNDYIMEEMAEENGFSQLPTKVSDEEYNQLLQEGNIRVQRVISDDENNSSDYYINEFKNGKIYYAGRRNMYGNGIYTSANRDDVETYSYKDKNSKVLELAIDKNSKIISVKDQKDLLNKLVTELKSIPSEYQRVMENPGRIFMMKGYDALYIESENYYVIYNRGKIYVKE